MTRTLARWLRRLADRLDPPLRKSGQYPPFRNPPAPMPHGYQPAPADSPARAYTVTAYRWGRRGEADYPVGCYATEVEALKAAADEEADRGGKYECEVIEWKVGVGIAQMGDDYEPRFVKVLERDAQKSGA